MSCVAVPPKPDVALPVDHVPNAEPSRPRILKKRCSGRRKLSRPGRISGIGLPRPPRFGFSDTQNSFSRSTVLSLPFGEAFSLWCGTNYYFALPLGFDQHNEAVPRVSIFVEVLMPGCIASEPRCGRGIGDHGAGQHRSLRHAGSEKKLVYAD